MRIADRVIVLVNGIQSAGIVIAMNDIWATVAFDAPVVWLSNPHQQKVSISLWKELDHPWVVGRATKEEMLTHYQEDVRKLGEKLWQDA